MPKKGKNGGKKTKPNNKALAKKEEFSDIDLTDIPGMVDGVIPGMENVDPGDITLPRLALIQGPSPVKDPDNPNAPTDGQFYHTGTMESYDAPVMVVPLFYNKAAAKFPENMGDPIECVSRDSKVGNVFGMCNDCEHNWKEWNKDEPPECTEIHEFICVMKDESPKDALPFIISFMRTSATTGKEWLRAIKYAGKKNWPMFGVQYEVGRTTRENTKGKFFILTVNPSGKIDPRPYYEDYKYIAEANAKGGIQTSYDMDKNVEDDDCVFPPPDGE